MIVFAALLLVLLLSPSSSDALPAACLPAPYPTTPQAPAFEMPLTGSSNAQAQLVLWRQPCTDGSGQTAALVRLTPISPNPSTCSFNFILLAEEQQFFAQLRKTPAQPVFCETLFVPVTYILIEGFGAPITFDAARAFALIQHDGTPTQVFVPALSSAFVPPTVTVVGTGCAPTCHSGQVVGYTMSFTNPGPPLSAEIKGGVRLPDGSQLPFVTTVTTIPGGPSSLSLVPSQALPGGLPAIDVLVEAAILEPALGVTLSRHNVTLHLLP